jgi:hypothetical protein
MVVITAVATVLAMVASASAAATNGAKFALCVGNNAGFDQGAGYVINLMYTDLQQQSRSSICKNFNNDFHKKCGNAAVNCVQHDDIVAIGVFVSKTHDFDCPMHSFERTLQATIDFSDANAACFDVPIEGGSSKMIRGDSLARRNFPLDPNNPPIAQMELPTKDNANAIIKGVTTSGEEFDWATTTINNAVDSIATTMSGLASNLQAIELPFLKTDQGRDMTVKIEYDTGSRGARIDLEENEWKKVIPSMVALLRSQGRKVGTIAFFIGGTAFAGKIILEVAVI